jgi:hypothetical protein
MSNTYIGILPPDLKIELCRKIHHRWFSVVLDELLAMTLPINLHLECEHNRCLSCPKAINVNPIFLFAEICGYIVVLSRWGMVHPENTYLLKCHSLEKLRQVKRDKDRYVCRWLN